MTNIYEHVGLSIKLISPKIRSTHFSAFAPALVCFTLINIALVFVNPIHFDPYKFPYHSWSWWTMHDLRTDLHNPNIILLGSSLTVNAVADGDANFLHKQLDLTEYRKAAYLDASLHKTIGGTYNTINLSSPGQIPSDSYITLKAALDSGKKPKLVIYGIAPRDFLDGTMSEPAATETFKFLQRIVDVDAVVSDLFLSPITNFNWRLQKDVYLYHYAPNLQESASLLFNRLYLAVLSAVPELRTVPDMTNTKRPILLPSYHPLELAPGVLMVQITDKASAMRDHNENANLRDYRDRYRNPDKRIYNSQFKFLGLLADMCKNEGISLVLINMPITEKNAQLLPQKVFQKYLQDVGNLAFAKGVPFLNLCEFNRYTPFDYRDSVHFNGLGGEKFISRLVDKLAQNQTLRMTVLAASGQPTHNAIASTHTAKFQPGL
jgi:hypothetical protein